MMTFDDWYGVDIKLRGSPRPIAEAAWEAGLAEGIRREQEAHPRLAPEHARDLRLCLAQDKSCQCQMCILLRAALAAPGEE